MFIPKRRLVPAIFAGTMGTVVGISGTVGSAAEPSQQELSDQIKALQAKVDQMQARQDAADKASSDATTQSVLNDATKHDQLMDVESYTGGWNSTKKQFFIGSEDGNFYLHPGIIFQFRGNIANAERSKRSGSPQTTDGFEIRRAKFYFDGNVFTPDLTYKFQ